MHLVKNLIITVVILFLLAVSVGLLLPKEYKVKRSIVIQAPVEEVYDNVVDLKAWQQWGVWFTRDPSMEVAFSGPDRAIGMQSQWESETQGDGEMKITELEHAKRIEYRLYFPDMDVESKGAFTFSEKADGTHVTWVDSGDVGESPLNRYFVLIVDDMIGPDFETGLENLKTVTENSLNHASLR